MATEIKVIEIKVINIEDYIGRVAELTKSVDVLKEANKKLDKATTDYNVSLAKNNLEIKKAQAEIKTLTNEVVNETKIREKRAAQIDKAVAKEIVDQQKAEQQAAKLAMQVENEDRRRQGMIEKNSQAETIASQKAEQQAAKKIGYINELKEQVKQLEQEYYSLSKAELEAQTTSIKSNTQESAVLKSKKSELAVLKSSYDAVSASVANMDAEIIKLNAKGKTSKANSLIYFSSFEKDKVQTLSVSINLLEKEINELTLAEQRLNSTQTVGTKNGNQILSDLTAKRAELSKLQQAYGNYGLQVGNYGSATKMLGINIGQVMKEMPNFAISARIGIMSLTNNLPMLAESIKSVTEEQKAMKIAFENGTSMEKPTSMIKMFASSIFGLTGIMSIAMVLMQIYGGDIIEWVGKLLKGEAAVKKLTAAQLGLLTTTQVLNKAMKDGGGVYGDAVKSIEEMSTQLKVATGNKKEEIIALNKYNEGLGENFGKAKNVAEALQLIADKKDAYIDAMMKMAYANAFLTQSQEDMVKQIEVATNSNADVMGKSADKYIKTIDTARKRLQEGAKELVSTWDAVGNEATQLVEISKNRLETELNQAVSAYNNATIAERKRQLDLIAKHQGTMSTQYKKFYKEYISELEKAGIASENIDDKKKKTAKETIDTNTFLTALETAHQTNIAKIKENYKNGTIETETDFNTKLLAADLAYYKTAETAITKFLSKRKELDEKLKADLLNKQADFHLKSVEQEIKFKQQINKILLDNNPLKKEENEFNERKAAAGLYGVKKEKMTKDQLAALAILEQQHADIVYDINMKAQQKELRRKEDAFEKEFGAKREANLKEITDSENSTTFNVGMGGLSKNAEFDAEMALAQLRIDKINEEITVRKAAGLETVKLNKDLANSEQDLTQIYVNEFSRRMQEAQQYGTMYGEALGAWLTDSEDKGKAILQTSLQIGLKILAQYLTQLVASYAAKNAIEVAATATSVGVKTTDAIATAALDTGKAVTGSMASPQSIATAGVAGGVQAALLTGLIAAGLAASLAIVNSLFNTGKSVASVASPEITKTTMQVTEKFHTGGIGEKADSKTESDEITKVLLKTERILSPTQTSVFDSILTNIKSYGGSEKISGGVGVNDYLQEAMFVRALSVALKNQKPQQISWTEYENQEQRQKRLKNNLFIQ